MAERVYNVLFLCTGNSARSIMAEAIMNRLGRGHFKAHSAGSHPNGEVNPHAVTILERMGYDTGFARSKSWDEFEKPGAPQMDFVFTVCDNAARESCPIWHGHPMKAHWGIPDPAVATGPAMMVERAFTDAYRMLERRISAFVSLPLSSIDKLALQHRLDAIGHISDAQSDPDVA